MKQKHVWNKGWALVWYMHPFKDEPHLRKKLVRWPRWEPESDLIQVYSEELGSWLDTDYRLIKTIYKIYGLNA